MTFLKFIFAEFLSFLPGLIGLIVAPVYSGQNMWYNTLAHSTLTPEGWVFSVVWSILYCLIGLALFFIMIQSNNKNNRKDKISAYTLFGINIVLNALWSLVFFGAQSPTLALILLMGLIITAIFMARAFFRLSKTAFWLVVPYILWLMFAFYLNGMIIYLN